MAREVLVTVGLPASGKTTYTMELIQKNPEYVNVNRDDIRLAMQGRGRYAKFSKWREETVTATATALAKESLAQGKSVIISDTNLDPNKRKVWSDMAKAYGVGYREVLFTDVPYGVCIQRDARREHPVGSKVIMGMYNRYKDIYWNTPAYDENLPDAYIFDVDGTLAQMNGRSPFAWDKVDTDLPKEDVIQVLHSLHARGNKIIICSGRDGSCKELTEDWFRANGIWWDEFFIRPAGDNRKDYLIKEEIYRNNIEGKFNVLGVFDDRDQVVHVWRHLGLTCFQVDYGDF